ncbi:DUF1365 domain-containing protein [Aquirhabdus parva]|uniref:DUF1365 domain-containing protein n=1 Tax=Aquirhabdus parva TaxID=2283318 RepID=A0A345P4V8_9GAMM|nr:DUF1365 domain-containing protein [Aquirhabdus parva]AXI02317.1 DUF1365 domain-containing protein [Aquirhabdus parva]
MTKAPALLIWGRVIHERLRPVQHRFIYPVFFVRLNLARLQETNSIWFGINRLRLLSLQTHDYGARDDSNLETWMRGVLHDAQIIADGEIWLQTFPRVFGFVFNPVSFWHCYDRSGALRAVLAEVNNTFGETHRYLLTAENHRAIDQNNKIICTKKLHVSPFCEVKGFYQFRFRDNSKSVFTSIDYHDEQGLLIKTAISGSIEIMNSKQQLKALILHPLLTFGIVARIHWQALKLWLKRVPFFSKPESPAYSISTSEENKNDSN